MKIDRQRVFDKCNGKCAYCGCKLTSKWQLDHLIPQWYCKTNPPYASEDEVHCFDNYVPACHSCNNYKSGNPLESFRAEIKRQPEKLMRDSTMVRIAQRFGLLEFIEKPVVFYFETLLTPPNQQ